MSCSRRSTARRRCSAKSGGTWALYSASLPSARNARSKKDICHVHMLISIPPKYSVAEVIGYLKGKSSIWIAQNVERKLRNFLGHKFWARGYYIRNREIADKQLDQLQLKLASHKVPSLVPESFITASGGSPSNPQLCWGLLAH